MKRNTVVEAVDADHESLLIDSSTKESFIRKYCLYLYLSVKDELDESLKKRKSVIWLVNESCEPARARSLAKILYFLTVFYGWKNLDILYKACLLTQR